MKLREIANLLEAELVGDGASEIVGVGTIEDAKEGEIAFIIDPKYSRKCQNIKASAILLNGNTSKQFNDKNLLIAQDIQLATVKLLKLFNRWVNDIPSSQISSLAFISPNAHIGEDVSVGHFSSIMADAKIGDRTKIASSTFIGSGVQIGEDCQIHPNVTIREGTQIGNRVIIHAGAVIGGDGFGYLTNQERTLKMPQIGRVIIEDDCEIGSNTTIDRGTIRDTVIGEGSKIDNLVQIAHNVKLGKRCFLAAQVGIAGSTILEDEVCLRGQVGVTGHIRLGKRCVVGAQAGVTKSVAPGEFVSGYPARAHFKSMKEQAALAKLPVFIKEVKKALKELRNWLKDREQ